MHYHTERTLQGEKLVLKNALGLCLLVAIPLSSTSAFAAKRESKPDFGPNVKVFNPATSAATMQQQIDQV